MAISVLLYNDDGSGTVGTLEPHGLIKVHETFAPHAKDPKNSFAEHWTSITTDSDRGSLFYNASSGAAAYGWLLDGNFKMGQTYSFSKGWTNIVSSNFFWLFYERSSGKSVLNFAPSTEPFDVGKRWTHVVDSGQYLLFYNAVDTGGAVFEAYDSTPNPGELHLPDAISMVKPIPPGSFSRWTHIVSEKSTGTPTVLFYSSADGTGALGQLDALGLNRGKEYPGKSGTYFARGWSHVVSSKDLVFFYNQTNGGAALGKISHKSGYADFLTLEEYAVSPGYTQIALSVNWGIDVPGPWTDAV